MKVGTYDFTIEEKEDFFVWLKYSYGSATDFMNLKPSNREKIFLRWKWGFKEESSNEELEMTRQNILNMVKDIDYKDEGYKFYFEKMRQFKNKCNEIKSRIGLKASSRQVTPTKQKTSQFGELAKNVLNQFNGSTEEI